jgi:hypothetical protein
MIIYSGALLCPGYSRAGCCAVLIRFLFNCSDPSKVGRPELLHAAFQAFQASQEALGADSGPSISPVSAGMDKTLERLQGIPVLCIQLCHKNDKRLHSKGLTMGQDRDL